MDGVIFSGEIFWRKMSWHDLAGEVGRVVVAVTEAKANLVSSREEQRRLCGDLVLDWQLQGQLAQSL